MKYKDNKNKRGFTLIELIAVLVILAIIAIIVTPLIMSIVKKAKDSVNKRSVDAYGKAVELAAATYLLDTGDYPTSLDNLEVEYSGNEVVCNVKKLNEDGSIYLSECSISGRDVKDSSAEDGYYHYGKTIEVEYDTYVVGDKVTYNGMEFYVIGNRDENSDRVTMLKAVPLTVDEVNTYGGVGTENNHVNMYVTSDTTAPVYQTAYDRYGYGGMAYYTSETCGYNGTDWVEDGCTSDYEKSEVKYVVDAWAKNKFSNGDLVEDETGYSARLLTSEDLTGNLGYVFVHVLTCLNPENTASWVYNSNYTYWTMVPHEVYPTRMGNISTIGSACDASMYLPNDVVRPVVTLKKSAI